MKIIKDSELEKVNGGATYLDGTCSGCGKTFETSNGLKVEYKGKKCQAKKEYYYCDVCGSVVNFNRVTGDGS